MGGPDGFFWMVWITLIVGGVLIIIAAMIRRLKIVEMEHRERMAMIERGMTPGPSLTDPIALIRKQGDHVLHERPSTIGRRMLSGGIAVMGFGFGLMVLMAIAAGSEEAALGVGGAIVVVGLSFVVIALVQGERPRPPHSLAPPFSAPPASPPPPAPRPPDRES